MVFSNIDSIVRRWLLDRGYPIHYYSEALYHAASCLRDLSKDTLQIVNARLLPVSNLGDCQLPDDYSDDVLVGLLTGGRIFRLPRLENISPIRLHNETTGEFEAPSNNLQSDANGYPFFQSTAYTWFWKIDSWGEFTGGFFGATGATGGYQVFRNQNRLVLSNVTGNAVIMQYISDGQSIDSATQIDTRAIRCIITYIDWQRSRNATNLYSPEGKTFLNEKRLLRAQMNPLTTQDIIDALRRSYTATIKN